MKHRTFSLDRVPSWGEGGSPLPVSLTYPPPFVNAFLKKSLGSPGIKNIFEKMLTAPLSSVNLSVCKKIGPLDPFDGPRLNVKKKNCKQKMRVKFGGCFGAKVKHFVKKFKKKYPKNCLRNVLR